MSSNFTPEDYSELQIESNQVLAKLEQLDITEWQKKKDLIEKFVDVNRKLLDGGKISIPNKKDFCSYIVSKLTERNITVNRNGNFYRMFNSDEKGDQAGIQELDIKSKNISSSDMKTVDQKFKEVKEHHIKKDDEFTRFFEIIKECFKEGDTLNDAMLEKYNESEELAEVMRGQLDLEKLIPEFIAIHATLKLARENIDDRSKWLAYHKVKAQFLCKVGETKAQLAKMMRYCSKYASIGIERDPEVTEYWKWLGTCPRCDCDVAQELTYQVKLHESGKDLTIDTPLKGY